MEEPQRRVPPKPKKKWTSRDWMLVGVGLVLHLFAAIIIIILVMNYLGSQSPNKGPKGPVPKPTPKTKLMGPGMGSAKPASDIFAVSATGRFEAYLPQVDNFD